MPAKSESQQRFMGMVHAHKKGELDSSSIPDDVMKKVRKTAKSMTDEEAKKYASTKHKGLPDKVSEARSMTFKSFLAEQLK